MAQRPIEYVPNDDFHSAAAIEFEEADVDFYAEDVLDDSADDAEQLVLAIDQLRLLSAEGERFLFRRLNFLRFRASALQATLAGVRTNRKTQTEINRLLDEANQTRTQLVYANLRLIRSIARRHSASPEEFDEFAAESNAILLNAIDKFDYARGFRFSTYVTHAVQRHLRRLIQRKQKERDKIQSSASLEHCPATCPLTEMGEKKLLDAVRAIVDGLDQVLDPREKHIVSERFGLSGCMPGKSMKVIGDELGLSKERVRQLLQSSLEKLADFARPLELNLD